VGTTSEPFEAQRHLLATADRTGEHEGTARQHARPAILTPEKGRAPIMSARLATAGLSAITRICS
jgi:hypothetical protein